MDRDPDFKPRVSLIGPGVISQLLAALVRTPSVNPAFNGAGEDRIAAFVESRLTAACIPCARLEGDTGRPSIVARLHGSGGGPALMLYAHLDTVGVEGMEEPFEPRMVRGRMLGRGAYDMKGGLAACIAALEVLHGSGDHLRGDVLLAAVSDEEEASLGIREVLLQHTADAAIVTEPTNLELCVAHKGFCWVEVETRGRAAHGSRPAEGVDANLAMGAVLHTLAELEHDLRTRAPHPLLGPPSLHVARLDGGTGASTYAARCVALVERRTVPGETDGSVIEEIDRALEAARRHRPGLEVERRLMLSRPAFVAEPDSPIERAVDEAVREVTGAPPPRVGASFWMDASLIAGSGIPTVVIGPVGGGAHAPDEWVDLASVERLADILIETARRYCGVSEEPPHG
jgi:acetylornithine deacetylase